MTPPGFNRQVRAYIEQLVIERDRLRRLIRMLEYETRKLRAELEEAKRHE